MSLTYRKYPHTPHLPYSRSRGEGDFEGNGFAFYGSDTVVTEKMDGENTTLYTDKIHARSMDSVYHPSRSWAVAFHAANCWKIPAGVRVVCENMYALHSVPYTDLESYLYGIAVIEDGVFWSWDDACLMFNELGIPSVPLLWRGCGNDDEFLRIASELDITAHEGFVVRTAGSFMEDDFALNVAKWVRPHHVQTDEHWSKNWTRNGLRTI